MLRSVPWTLSTLLLLGLAGCPGDKEGDDTSGDDTGDTNDTNDTGAEVTYTIEGTAISFNLEMPPAPEGACVTALDPAQGIEGGTPEELAEGVVDAAGGFTLTGVRVTELPPLLVIDDCDTSPPRVFPTGTPVAPELIQGVADGDVVTGAQAISLGVEAFDAMVASLDLAGSAVDVSAEGLLFGLTWDPNTQTPIPGAVVACDGCAAYYGDGDASDGLFTTGGALNAATGPGGLYAIPGAPIADYSATAEGYTFDTVQGGAIPAGAMFLVLRGTPG